MKISSFSNNFILNLIKINFKLIIIKKKYANISCVMCESLYFIILFFND